MQCKLCLQQKKLVNSHIIPSALYSKLQITEKYESVRSYPTSKSLYPKRYPTGVYDQIVCEDCERLFSEGDTFANEFFNEISFSPSRFVKNGKSNCGELYYGSDFSDLKYFSLSLLWRSHVSNKREFGDVYLGSKHERIVRSALLKNNPVFSDYNCVICKYEAPKGPLNKLKNIIWSPIPKRVNDGGNDILFYKFVFAGWIMFVKVDSRDLIGELGAVSLKKDVVPVVYLDYEKSDDLNNLEGVVKQMKKCNT